MSMIFISFKSLAQPNNIFTHYSSEQGLSQNSIMSIAQDNDGFMWFSTWDGINKFDGYDFKVYKARQGNKIGLSNNRVDLLKVDKYNYVWALTYDKRVYRLDKKNEYFEPVTCGTEDGQMDCLDIKTLSNGTVWIIAEGNGAIRVKTNPIDFTIKWNDYAVNQTDGYKAKVKDVIEDYKNNEWLVTNNGLVRISNDESKNPIFYFVDRHNDSKENRQSFFSSCVTRGYIYFGSNNGRVWKYSTSKDEFTLINLSLKDDVVAINKLSNGNIIFTTSSSGFIIHNIKTGKDELYNISTLKNITSALINSVYVDKFDEIWFETLEKGSVAHFNPNLKKYNIEYMSVDAMGAEKSYPSFHICEDVNGNLWVHPNGGGLGWYDRENSILRPFFNDPKSKDWKFSNKVHSMFSDKQGNLWICTHSKGLEKISFYGSHFKLFNQSNNNQDLTENTVRALFQDKYGRVWVAKRNSKIELYSTTNEYLGFLNSSGTISKTGEMIDGVAYHIMQDKNDNIWIGTKGRGIILLEPKDKNHYKITRFEYNSDDIFSISSNSVYYIHQDRHGRIWIATFGEGINYIDKDKSGKYVFINSRNNLKGYPIDNCYRVRHITSDTKGNLWVSTNDGLIRFKDDFKSPQHIKYYIYSNIPGSKDCFINSNVYKTIVSKKGELYFATFGGGLNKLTSIDNMGLAHFKSYTINDGLLSDILLSIEEDDSGNFWISTESGLSKFYPDKNIFENYNERDFGTKVRFEEGTSVRLSNNELLFGTSKGILKFNPQMTNKSDFVPPLALIDLKVCNKLIVPGDGNKILDNNINSANKITLLPEHNVFSITFAALDMTSTNNIKYAYTLKGFDNDWNYVGNQRSATYTNLSPGKYTLHVKSTNGDGVWVNNDRYIDIVILPSFWETPIAIVLYVILFIIIFLICVYILFTIYRLKHEVTVEQKITDIKLRFFTNISHELRTPLTLITGPLELVMKNQSLPNDVREQLQLVEKNSDRMLRLVNQILDFRKIQKNKMKLQVEYIDVVPFVKHIMENFDSLAKEHNIDFIFQSEKDELKLWFDTDKLEKIVFNLLSNAFKYTQKGKMITLFVHENESNIAVGIQDQGIGISENKKSSLFVRFETLLDNNLFNLPSTGIGLSLVKELSDIHKAEIKVESVVGTGSCFTIVLSKDKNIYENYAEFILNDDSSENKVIEDNINVDSLERINKISVDNNLKTMLLVEDNMELRLFLRNIFSSQYNVIEALDGNQGIDKAMKYVPDIIITDIMMPGIDGIEMTKKLKDNLFTSHIPIILLTAKIDMDSKLNGMALGADDYIIKPFNSTYLKARVENIIEQRIKLQKIYCDRLLDPSSNTLKKDENDFGLSTNDRKFMNKLSELLEKNIDNGNLMVADIVDELAVSRTVFFKKLKSLTGLSPIEFIKEMRIKKAAQLIETGEYNMTEISYMVGINDPRYFSKCFKSKYGITPTEYRDSYKNVK